LWPVSPNQLSSETAPALGRYYVVDTPSSHDRQERTVVLIRQQIQGRIVNGWLILITILGALVSVADGLTRSLDPELDLPPLHALEYEPNRAAFLLAAVTLPLMLAYIKKARVSFTEGLFLWLAFCTAAYLKDFSYLRLPGASLFVTDVILVVLLFSIYILARPHYPRNPLALNIFLVLFLAAGIVSAARGFWEHRDFMLVLRDSALIIYPQFLLVGYHVFRSWPSVKRLAAWFLLGAALSVLNGLAWFVVAPGQRRFVSVGIYILVSLIAVLLMMANRLIRPKVGWTLAAAFSLGLLLANMRSLFTSLAVVMCMVFLVPGLMRKKSRLVSVVATLVLAIVLGCSFALLFFHLQAGRDFATRIADGLDSAVLHTGDDPYWQFRLAAWSEAWRRFEKNPAGGEGFGIPFVFAIWDNDARPHNTFLTVLYKMGLIGFLPLFAFLAYFFWCGLRAVHRNSENRRVAFLQIMILAQGSFCLYGAANLLLESPFLASLFWAGMGLGLRTIQILDSERINTRVYLCRQKEQKHFLETRERRPPPISKQENARETLSWSDITR
jgi:O-antigen ligase